MKRMVPMDEVLAIVDRAISDATNLSLKRQSEEDHCGYARWAFHAKQLSALRSKLLKSEQKTA